MSRATSRQHDLAQRDFARILIVKPSSLGDVVHALPVLHGLRVRYPLARIDWLVASPFASLLEGHPELNEVVVFDRQRFGRVGRSPRAALEFLRFLRGLRSRRYDLVIDLQGLFRSGFLTRITGAPVRLGFRSAPEAAWIGSTDYLSPADPDVHAVERNYQVAKLLGFAEVPVEFKLPVSERVQVEAAQLLNSSGVRAEDRIVAVAPGARWETKRWPVEYFGQTVGDLEGRLGVRCVLIGGKDEAELCGQVMQTSASAPVNLAGLTSLPQLVAVLARADVVLCHDSAAAHLAAALDRPLVCLTGPTNPRRTGPYGRLAQVLQLPVDCAPCYLRRLSQCPHQHRCLRELESKAVTSAVLGALGQT